MIFRSLDSDGDWVFGNGASAYARTDKAIALNIQTRLLSWLNDCFFAQLAGIDWKTRLGSKNQDKLLEADIRRIIAQSYGVTSIIALDITLINRKFRARYEVATIFSTSFNNTINQAV